MAEMGSHEELLKKEGVYYNLVHAQVSESSVGELSAAVSLQLTEEVAEGESAPSQSPLTPLSPLLSPGFGESALHVSFSLCTFFWCVTYLNTTLCPTQQPSSHKSWRKRRQVPLPHGSLFFASQ